MYMYTNIHVYVCMYKNIMNDYTARFARIFVINLDRRPQRWVAVLRQLKQAGVPTQCVTRVSAVDGARLDIRKLYLSGLLSKLGYRRLQEPVSNRIWGMDLNAGALGCALSHIHLWSTIAALDCHHAGYMKFCALTQQVPDIAGHEAAMAARAATDLVKNSEDTCVPASPIACPLRDEKDMECGNSRRITPLSGLPLTSSASSKGSYESSVLSRARNCNDRQDEPIYLILEDDACLPQNFLDAYSKRTRHVPADCELLYLGGLDTAQQCSALSVASGVCRVPQLHRTTTAYTVTARAARALLDVCTPLTYQLDTMMTMHVRGVAEAHVQPWCDKSAAVASSMKFVHNPCCYTLQPPLVTQDGRFDSDIQETLRGGE